MVRRIIEIDEKKCNGCGACVTACHEGAIALVDGKARLMRDDYCDGLGDCLPSCPAGAITFTEREAMAYDEKAVKEAKLACGCPGSMAKSIERESSRVISRKEESALMQWPVQVKLMPVSAPYYENADLLIAADCTAYAYASFHSAFISGRITLVGCPKLDNIDYSEKLSAIFASNNIKSILVVRMEVPCCGGLEMAVKRAVDISGKDIPVDIVTISTDGKIL